MVLSISIIPEPEGDDEPIAQHSSGGDAEIDSTDQHQPVGGRQGEAHPETGNNLENKVYNQKIYKQNIWQLNIA